MISKQQVLALERTHLGSGTYVQAARASYQNLGAKLGSLSSKIYFFSIVASQVRKMGELAAFRFEVIFGKIWMNTRDFFFFDLRVEIRLSRGEKDASSRGIPELVMVAGEDPNIHLKVVQLVGSQRPTEGISIIRGSGS
jgi:hypothetical protein